ncbi:MAG: DUF962 domain-containing protein [Salibacteraceae bacterium]
MQDWFDAYGESHQNSFNKLVHWICVPLIFFSVIGLLASIPHDYFSSLLPAALAPFGHWGLVLLFLGLLFYLRLSFTMFLGMAMVSLGMLMAVRMVEDAQVAPLWMVSLIVFIVAWIGQFYGHKVEGKKPSFLQDIQFLLIGPSWLLGFIYRKIGLPY